MSNQRPALVSLVVLALCCQPALAGVGTSIESAPIAVTFEGHLDTQAKVLSLHLDIESLVGDRVYARGDYSIFVEKQEMVRGAFSTDDRSDLPLDLSMSVDINQGGSISNRYGRKFTACVKVTGTMYLRNTSRDLKVFKCLAFDARESN